MPYSNSKQAPATLRGKAEKVLKGRGKKTKSTSSSGLEYALEELRIHEAELEIQNEELQQSRTQLEESQARYFRHFDLAPVGMIRLDPKGMILEANILGAKMLAIDRRRLHSSKAAFGAYVAHAWQKTFHAHLKSTLASAKMESCELSLQSVSGAQTFVRMQSIVSHGVDDAPDLFVTLTDLTEHQRLHKKLAEQKHIALTATMAKDQFLAILSHELRTPLTPVLLLIEELGRNPALSDQDRTSLSVVRRNLELETLLIDDLLDLTRIISGRIELNREIADVRVCLMSAVEICRHAMKGKQLELKLDLNAIHHIVDADCKRLQQIIWNLLQNAIKFTAIGGCVSIRLFNNLPGRLALAITDTGIGIESKSMLHIFDPFAQAEHPIHRNFGGLGLGLAISRSLAQAHGGSLTALSTGLGEGSTFRLELPALDLIELPVAKRQPETSPSRRQTKPHLLLVEDHDDTRTTLVSMLTRQGYDVEGVADAFSAEALCDQKKFDVLISDIALPDRSGLDLMIEVKERHQLAGIAMSGFGMQSDIAMSRAAGFSEHLIKPIDMSKLEAAIERVVASDEAPSVPNKIAS